MKHSKSFSVAAKLFSVFLLCCLVCSLFVGFVGAQNLGNVVVIDSITSSNAFNGIYSWLGAGLYTGVGAFSQVFTGNGLNVSEVQFLLARNGLSASDVFLSAHIYSVGVNNFPSALLASSSNVVVSNDLPETTSLSGFVWTGFVFDGSFEAEVGVVYCVVVQADNAGLSAQSAVPPWVRVAMFGSGGVFATYTAWTDGQWVTTSTGNSLCFIVLSGIPDAGVVGGGDGAVGADLLLLVLFFVVSCLVWVFAVVRQSLGLCLLSSVCWFGFAFVLYLTAGAADAAGAGGGLVAGFALLSVLLGVVMVVLSLYASLKVMRLGVEKREMDEGVF